MGDRTFVFCGFHSLGSAHILRKELKYFFFSLLSELKVKVTVVITGSFGITYLVYTSSYAVNINMM